MSEDRDAELRARIREGMRVLGMDGGPLGRVFDVGVHALALERGAFLPHEWTASFAEVERVDEQGVWLKHGRGSLERVSDAYCGPIEPYRAAAEASPASHFRPPAVAQRDPAPPPSSGGLPTPEAGSPGGPATDDAQTAGGDAPPRR